MSAAGVTAMSGANRAATAARKKLIEAHQDEYNGYVREERTKLGLPADPKEAKLMARRDKLEQELAKIKRELDS